MDHDSYIQERPLVSAEHAVKALIIAVAIMVAGLLASSHHTGLSLVAFLCFGSSMVAFTLTSMWFVTVKMNVNEGSVSFGNEVREARIAIPFIVGILLLIAGMAFTAAHIASTLSQ